MSYPRVPNISPTRRCMMDPRSIDALVLTLGASNGFAVTTAKLEAAGLSRKQVAGREGRLLTRVSPGVYAVGPVTHAALTSAALLAMDGAVLSHRSAARLHGLPIGDPGGNTRPIEVLSTHRTRARIDGVRFRTTKLLAAEDVTRQGRQAVTTSARTLCDLAPSIHGRRLQHLVEYAITEELMTVAEFQACLLSYCRRGRRGSTLLRRVGDLVVGELVVGGDPLLISRLEQLTIRLLTAEGLTGWISQFVPPWHDGIRGTVDFAWANEKVLLEVDGRRWHSVTQAFDDDRRRDQAAMAAGWWPIRAGWQQVTQRPGELVAVLRQALGRS